MDNPSINIDLRIKDPRFSDVLRGSGGPPLHCVGAKSHSAQECLGSVLRWSVMVPTGSLGAPSPGLIRGCSGAALGCKTGKIKTFPRNHGF